MNFKDLYEPAGKPTDEAVIETLAKSQLPVVLYGNTPDVAEQIIKKLKNNNIDIDLIVFDEESPIITEEKSLLKNVMRISVNELNAKSFAYNVITGFVKGYQCIESIKRKFKFAHSVSYLSEIFDMEIITQEFVKENREFLEGFYNHLADQRSKDSYIAYLLSKTRQDMKFLPPVFDKTQYFPSDIIKFSENESYIDCGAFIGDTIEDFLRATGNKYKKIWAIEPDRNNYKKLTVYLSEKKLNDIESVNKGIYNYSGKLPFVENASMLSMINEKSDNCIEVDTIDNITAGEPVTYIKLDIEGAELEALKGAEQTIKKYRPTLGISIYHKKRDLIDIPLYINQLIPEYKFYFRVHKKLAIDTVMYCIDKRREI
ncbi:MAG: FkbM family methyltransferase [Tannerella sp.]|jgi:FkbM family methyltransferase|nr:FkbM family methyltransferase [Tannerella sp.]